MFALCSILTLSFFFTFALSAPIYGIVSTPSDFPDQYDPGEYSYIKESAPEFLSMADGNSVFIPYDLADSELFPILDAVDAVLFVGGDATYWTINPSTGKREFTYFMTQLQKITLYVREQNLKGRYLPLVGICQGMEVVLMSLTNNTYLLDVYFDANGHEPLYITNDGMQSRMFQTVTEKDAQFMAENGTLFVNLRFAYNVSSLDKYKNLLNSLTLTGIARDSNGRFFAAAVEAKDWPLYMTMFHPERVLWEQKVGDFTHAPEMMHFVQGLAKFYVSEAQKGIKGSDSKGVLDKWYFSRYESIEVEPGRPKVFLAKRREMINPKQSYCVRLLSKK